ncbi:hypothetical protein CLAIMM_11964 isoform 5 [Cladophialophora immunda]|nr:hypothetical protein CLAIMM_11964 isoform 5 [Cladophialophora immunda]
MSQDTNNMASGYSTSQSEPQSNASEESWSEDHTNLLILALQRGDSYEDLQKDFLPKRTVEACKARIETLEKNGELPDVLIKDLESLKRKQSSQSGPSTRSQRKRVCYKQAPETSAPRSIRNRRILPRKAISTGDSGDSPGTRESKSRNTTYLSPDSSPAEESNNTCIVANQHTDAVDLTTPAPHDGTNPSDGANLVRPPPEIVGRGYSKPHLCEPQINGSTNDQHKIQEDVSSRVEIERIYLATQEILAKISEFNAKYSPADVNDLCKDSEWCTNFRNIDWLLMKWTSDLLPKYKLVNMELPIDAPVEVILAHLSHKIALIQLHAPVAYVDRLRGSSRVEPLHDVICISATKEIISIIEQYLKKPSVEITRPQFVKLSAAISYAWKPLAYRCLQYQSQDIFMIQKISETLTELLRLLVVDESENLVASNSRNDDHQETVMVSQSGKFWVPGNTPNPFGCWPTARENNSTLFNSRPTPMEGGSSKGSELNLHNNGIAGGQPSLPDQPQGQRQRGDVESNVMAYPALSESSETLFSPVRKLQSLVSAILFLTLPLTEHEWSS